MTTKRRSALKCRSLLLAGMLTMGSSGCSVWDNPGYLYSVGVATGVLDGLIAVSVDIIGQQIGDVFFPNQQAAP